MKKYRKIVLTISILGIVAGTLIKLSGEKTFGDVLLALGSIGWLIIIVPLILSFLNRNNKLNKL